MNSKPKAQESRPRAPLSSCPSAPCFRFSPPECCAAVTRSSRSLDPAASSHSANDSLSKGLGIYSVHAVKVTRRQFANSGQAYGKRVTPYGTTRGPQADHFLCRYYLKYRQAYGKRVTPYRTASGPQADRKRTASGPFSFALAHLKSFWN